MIDSQSTQDELSNAAKMDMKSSSGWIKFAAVMMFVFGILTGIVSIPFFTSNFDHIPAAALFGFSPSLFGYLIVFMALVLFVLGYFLFAYAIPLKNASTSGSLAEMEKGLPAYKNYFLTFLILTALSLIMNAATLTNLF